MNLMERDPHKNQKGWREDMQSERKNKQSEEYTTSSDDLDYEKDSVYEKDRQGNLGDVLQRPYMTPVLLGIIAVLLICIVVLLMFMPSRRKTTQADVNSELQQSITDYAQEQKLNDYVSGLSGETVSVEPVDEQDIGGQENKTEPAAGSENSSVAADSGKTVVVVDMEDENDESYSKEFILNEALPYFADNDQNAIWDLAHLKRYVKLSAELEKTNQYYYKGGVNSAGRPNGKGLAIYEDNSYYYGDWSDGVRSGNGTWFRFYINEKSKRNAMGKYTAHSYSGEWADDLPNGQGAEHYDVDISKLEGGERVLQNIVGGFDGGLYDGELYGYTVNHLGTVEEWDGVASKGVFSLWRDMSAIGECSVWRNKDDHVLCLDIDKSENKNQGIQELLITDTK